MGELISFRVFSVVVVVVVRQSFPGFLLLFLVFMLS